MSNENAEVEYVMRAKLPPWKERPSGGVDPEYRTAIFENMPTGFEVKWQTREEWPVDKDGLTWVRLYCTDQKRGLEYFIGRCAYLTRTVERMRELAKQIVG